MGNKKILVVDDESDMRIFVSTVVETMGFTPTAAEDGTEALEKARADRPALVILDVMMPKIEDGIRTYQQFRKDEGLCRIPIIMLSVQVIFGLNFASRSALFVSAQYLCCGVWFIVSNN